MFPVRRFFVSSQRITNTNNVKLIPLNDLPACTCFNHSSLRSNLIPLFQQISNHRIHAKIETVGVSIRKQNHTCLTNEYIKKSGNYASVSSGLRYYLNTLLSFWWLHRGEFSLRASRIFGTDLGFGCTPFYNPNIVISGSYIFKEKRTLPCFTLFSQKKSDTSEEFVNNLELMSRQTN